jgi:hypothetical protein
MPTIVLKNCTDDSLNKFIPARKNPGREPFPFSGEADALAVAEDGISVSRRFPEKNKRLQKEIRTIQFNCSRTETPNELKLNEHACEFEIIFFIL